ncbi:hypothetical protein [Halomonas borealis]|uniref:hypothetical protein n=1 Tax=Halomonas borealis TaxID=2508710 RepID=UPI0010A08825|nr:hypothetical protein [Halomonas borealis]
MPSKRHATSSRRRGATRRHRYAARRVDGTRFDRWLDRLVTLAVITALLVGGSALIVSLML